MKRDLYSSNEYWIKNPTYHVEDSPWKATQIMNMLCKHSLRPKSICELGCGAGEILRQIQHRLPEATCYGYDISPDAIALAQARENHRLHFHCADLLDTDVEPFDLLLCIDVFEHVEDYPGFLKALRSRGTRTIFHIPLDMTAQAVLRRSPIMRERSRVGHLHYFMKDTALAALEDAGYQVVDWCYTASALVRANKLEAYSKMVPRFLLSLISHDLSVRALGGSSLLVLAK